MEIQQGEVDQGELVELEETVKADPLNREALKQLSILLVQDHQNEKANVYLAKALRIMPDDDALLFHQGLNYEFLKDTLSAMNYYVRYREVSTLSPYRKLMEGRYLYFHRTLAYKDIQYRVAKENTLSVKNIPANTLAVFPLNYYGSDSKYEPLSRGFSEMISIDLAKVKKLTVLERIRLKAVMDELEFSKSSQVDQSSAPRMGKILSARLLYSGSFDVTDEDNLKMEVNSWDINKNESGEWLNKTGKVEDLFLLEKEIVFDIINQIGIELTQDEKEQIERIPTNNINAFLEYSKGLEMQDNGQFDEAAVFFSNAIGIDPNFTEASINSDVSTSINNSSGTSDDLLGSTVNTVGGKDLTSTFKDNIVIDRLDVLGDDIRSTFDQGYEKREAPQEAASGTELPMPPPRPIRK
jgi:tetratricopeptide (TPR) repeat protein